MLMNCADYKRWFSPYIDERLEPQERRQLEGHLGKCAGCRSDLASLQEMLRSLRAMEPPAVPDLLPGIHRTLAEPPWWRTLAGRFLAPWPASLPLHGLALATSAVLAVCVVGLGALSKRGMQGRLQYAGSYERRASDSVGEQFAPSKPDSEVNRRGSVESQGLRREEPALEKAADVGARFEYDGVDRERFRDTAAVTKELALSYTAMPFAPPLPASSEVAEMARASRQEAVTVTNQSLSAGAFNPASSALMGDRKSAQFGDATLSSGVIVRTDIAETSALKTKAAAKTIEEQDRSVQVPVAVAVSGALSDSATEKSFAKSAEALKEDKAPKPSTGYAGVTTATPAVIPGPLQAQWKVADMASAASQITAWVSARQGFAVATSEHHLSIKLPTSDVAAFLQQFTTDPPAAPAVSSPIWITISLELVSPE